MKLGGSSPFLKKYLRREPIPYLHRAGVDLGLLPILEKKKVLKQEPVLYFHRSGVDLGRGGARVALAICLETARSWGRRQPHRWVRGGLL